MFYRTRRKIKQSDGRNQVKRKLLSCSRLLVVVKRFARGFKFRFGSHFGLDIEKEYFVFRIVSVYRFEVRRIYISIYIYIY